LDRFNHSAGYATMTAGTLLLLGVDHARTAAGVITAEFLASLRIALAVVTFPEILSLAISIGFFEVI